MQDWAAKYPKNNSVLATDAEQMAAIFLEIMFENEQVAQVQVHTIPRGNKLSLTRARRSFESNCLCKIATP